MSGKTKASEKHLKIDKANTNIVIAVSVSAFIVIFSLMTSKVLVSQYAYQRRVISAKTAAVKQLNTDVTSAANLVSDYKAFVNTPTNIIGGSSTATTGQNVGDNGKIILDALPSQYDFPGLTSSLDNLLSNRGAIINSISGSDEQLTQQDSQSSSTPTPVQMPFQLNVTAPYASIQTLMGVMQSSIRPIIIQTVDFSGSDSSLTASITAYTYYQPQKTFVIGTEVVK